MPSNYKLLLAYVQADREWDFVDTFTEEEQERCDNDCTAVAWQPMYTDEALHIYARRFCALHACLQQLRSFAVVPNVVMYMLQASYGD